MRLECPGRARRGQSAGIQRARERVAPGPQVAIRQRRGRVHPAMAFRTADFVMSRSGRRLEILRVRGAYSYSVAAIFMSARRSRR